MFVYELSGCGFKSCCCHLHIFLSIKKIVFWQLLQKADDFNQTPPPGSSKQSLGKSSTKAKWALPKHTPVKVKVISNLVTQLSPHSKTSVFSSARKSLNKPGWPPKKKTSMGLYCKIPGKARYKLLLSWTKRYYVLWEVWRSQKNVQVQTLLHMMQEVVAAYNEEHQKSITCYLMRDVIANERNIVMQALTPDDDCWCEICENSKLLLEAIKLQFCKAKQEDLADDLPSKRLALVEMGVCSSKDYPCITGQCEKCPGKTVISTLCEQLEKLAHITYFCWVAEGNMVKNKQEATGEEMAAMPKDLMIGIKMRWYHMYNT